MSSFGTFLPILVNYLGAFWLIMQRNFGTSLPELPIFLAIYGGAYNFIFIFLELATRGKLKVDNCPSIDTPSNYFVLGFNIVT